MAPSHLQGLNIVQPSPPANSYLSDADLLSLPPFPDLNAQLDLWTHLNFQSDEPLGLSADSVKNRVGGDGKDTSDEDAERYNDQDADSLSIAETTAHENVVTGTVLPPTGVAHGAHPTSAPSRGPSSAPGAGVQLPLDLHSLLSGMGIDPYLIPPAQQASAQAANANSLAQLLSLHAASFLPSHLQPAVPPLAQSAPVQATIPPQQQQASSPIPKRARTSRQSFSVEQSSPEAQEIEEKESSNPLTAAEDKRRRNTAASARFRLKKKEREMALERKAKELEVRVSELEKECEALRRENGWLKGLVVGVTGVGAVQQQQVGAGSTGAGVKRGREDIEGEKEEQ
ncbi:hypothetical protein POSPLADRAFT_1038393 [Postia placenta MAD-698-R-SB12]|uniref:BZIP domain-containing protein n=1 Tax=Postia placenta MAD-698-R-SB12 TaxID=670580 RepID=A0A1X6NAW6_9APHY|nr:hypothetical protein POSPLADRAFT_1038393 [Postia placenta MAD-698-R-SB12]OSX65788.1 hypothetical protein POSPLADRAFT_1038393 [Postia placenta MAD-698-R-SB12]